MSPFRPTTPPRKVWIDGELLAPDDAVIAFDDHGITVGDGAFETVRLVDGRPFALTRHLERLRASVAALALPALDLVRVRGAVDEVLAGPGRGGFLRITVTAGRAPLGSPRGDAPPTVIVAVRPGEVRLEPTTVVVTPFTRNERGALAGIKSTSYAENVVALEGARHAGASEALFANTAGLLCEGTGSNVFVVIDDELRTPPLSSGCLAGVTRALILELVADAVEADIPMTDLPRASEMFLASTAREVQPVSAVDGVALPSCPGPWTARARRAWLNAYGDGATLDP